MRLKSGIWVSALLRRLMAAGQFGAVLHKGAEEAGAVMVVVNHLDGRYDLLLPPPGPAYDDEGERRFTRRQPTGAPWADIAGVIEKARARDPDLWVVEVEDRTGLAGIATED